MSRLPRQYRCSSILSLSFSWSTTCSPPQSGGEHKFTSRQISFRGFLHCYYEDVYGTRPVARELQHGLAWYYRGLSKPPYRGTIDRFLTDLEHVIDDIFDRFVEQAACRGLLDSTYSIDSTHVEAIQYNDAASWNYDPTAEEYYYGFGCTIVSTGAKIPIAAEFTQAKQADQETAMRVTRDALAVDTPVWMLGDSAYDILDWHDHLLAAGVVPIAPYNPRNTDDPKDIEYRVEDQIKEHSEDVQLNQSTLDETYNNRTGIERTNDAVKDCGLGHVGARGRVHARTEVFVALCLRLVVAITNHERGNEPDCEKL